LNLLINAGHALKSVATKQRRIEVSLKLDGAFVAATVRDFGTGIKPEHLPRLFDPFFTTKGPREGTGLGLSICHGIVRELKGDIHVESEYGAGTAMTVRLPAPALSQEAA
jgi:signal transduction histidine kinase